MTNEHGKSDRFVVPVNPPNANEEPVVEAGEGRRRAKGNTAERHVLRTQGRASTLSALERVRQAARRDRKQRFTALLHHVYQVEPLRAAYFAVKRDAAAGVDGATWQQYGATLEANLQDLAARLKRGAYRAKPVRRAYIPKADGRQRPLGVPTLEDKIVQRAAVAVLNAIYETDFLGFSYGFRPQRSPHLALDALTVGISGASPSSTQSPRRLDTARALGRGPSGTRRVQKNPRAGDSLPSGWETVACAAR